MKSQEGIIIILSLVMLFVVSTLIIGFLSYVNKSIEVTNREINTTKAFYIAEAGISDMLKYLPLPFYYYVFHHVFRLGSHFADGSYSVFHQGNHIYSWGFCRNGRMRVIIWYVLHGKTVMIDEYGEDPGIWY